MKSIAVFGGSYYTEDSPEFALAEEIGAFLIENGFALINGGNGGLMLASARGARRVKTAQVIGFVPEYEKQFIPNEFCTSMVKCPDRLERLAMMIHNTQGFIVLPGGIGTLSEFFTIWDMVRTLTIEPAPIILVGEFWKNLNLILFKMGSRVNPDDWQYLFIIDYNDPKIVLQELKTALGC